MGDCQNGDLRVRFDGRLKRTFLGSQVATDAGLVACRELDEALGLTEMSAERLQDSRLGQNKQRCRRQLSSAGCLRRSVEVAEKSWSRGGKSARYERRTPAKQLVGA